MNQEAKYELVKFEDGEFELEVNVSPKEETIWLSQAQMSLLFNVDRTRITRHINNIFIEKELDEESNVRKTHFTNSFKPTMLYSLNVIISVGYRVKSKRGVLFRIWANQVLKEYLIKGYAINENRVVVSNENFNNLSTVVNDIKSNQINISTRIAKLEDKVFDKEYGLNKLFFDGQFYDAYTLIQSIFEQANNEIIIIDNYIDRLTVKKNNVNVIIYINNNTYNLLTRDINTFNNQYGNLTVQYTTKVHDRYIIIDKTKQYHLCHSIRDYNKAFCVGKKIFSISKLDSYLINVLLSNI